ncbi:DUF1700 domain-containing protein [Vallitalea pronyensis]|uniref:DUF1700 domain-containing protein n=1 Tax=Vallitalea pronyensis TaxID=1348613 RepID=A0A8J8SF89_9FIRM|nr:DUF1700 domain-containing protein [Vallitalea pronyensis]QUI21385.1 DUF1700 domain-containing protein [Vallitalea pronyensis]
MSSLPKVEREKTLSYYAEIIDDQMEEGMTEEEAVDALGDVAHLADLAILNTPMSTLVKSKMRYNNNRLLTVLLILGFPLWFPLSVVFAVIGVALYIVAWAAVASVWVASASSVGAAVVSLFNTFFTNGVGNGVVFFGLFMTGVGLSVLLFFGAFLLSKLLIKFTHYSWETAKISLAKKRSA